MSKKYQLGADAFRATQDFFNNISLPGMKENKAIAIVSQMRRYQHTQWFPGSKELILTCTMPLCMCYGKQPLFGRPRYPNAWVYFL